MTSSAGELRDFRLPPEARLLLACARTNVTAEHEAQIRALVSEPIDWDYLILKAEQHGLAPLLYRNLGAVCPWAIPAAVMERLRARFRGNALRAMRLSAELVALLKLLEAARVDAIPLKGPTLAQAAYGDVVLRECADLDILIRPGDVPRAEEVLRKRGYLPEIHLAGPQRALALSSTKDLTFSRPNGAVVEVHWGLMPPRMPAFLDFDSLWSRVTTVNLNGYPVRSLGTEDLLLYLFVHGGKHHWSSLGWLCDVSRVIEHAGEVRWQDIEERAAAHRCLRVLRLGAVLVSGLFGAPVPPGLLREDEAAGEIVERAFAENSPELGPWATYRAQANLLDTARDKLRYWAGIFLTPDLADWLALPLPGRLFFLYYPLRPLRLLGRYLLRALRRTS